MDTHKTCTRCKKRLPITQFNKRAKAKDGLRQTCKPCDGEIRRLWFARQETLGPGLVSGFDLGSSPPKVVLPPGSGEVSGSKVERGGMAPAALPPGPGPESEPGGKVIGRIQPGPGVGPRIQEVMVDPIDEAEKAMARQYANLLNKKLNVRQRANLLVKIAKNAEGPTAALALAALRDINAATGITSKQGSVVDSGPLFVMPDGTSKMSMGGK